MRMWFNVGVRVIAIFLVLGGPELHAGKSKANGWIPTAGSREIRSACAHFLAFPSVAPLHIVPSEEAHEAFRSLGQTLVPAAHLNGIYHSENGACQSITLRFHGTDDIETHLAQDPQLEGMIETWSRRQAPVVASLNRSGVMVGASLAALLYAALALQGCSAIETVRSHPHGDVAIGLGIGLVGIALSKVFSRLVIGREGTVSSAPVIIPEGNTFASGFLSPLRDLGKLRQKKMNRRYFYGLSYGMNDNESYPVQGLLALFNYDPKTQEPEALIHVSNHPELLRALEN